ncbi:nucleoid-associated protein [Lichenibacterium ramalinae]|nr:nucleoid-associated protein [Lichenibacterium ramalinae]
MAFVRPGECAQSLSRLPENQRRGELANRIIGVAVHDLTRSGTTLDVRLSDREMAVSPTAQRVIDDLHALYGRRTGKAHGRFAADEDNYPTQRYLREYLDGDGRGFRHMTERMMGTLLTQARRKPNAGFGHVFFAHFEDDAGQFLLVAILNDKVGAALARDLSGVSDAPHLDLDGFRFAGRVAIEGWRADERRYVNFLKGKGDVADYFKEFLGCDLTMQAKAETQRLVEALRTFADGRGMDLVEREAFLSRARGICFRSYQEREELEFQTFANELVPDDPASLVAVLADPARGLSEGFVPDARTLRLLVSYRAKTPLWSIEFDRAALTAGQIEYRAADETLVVRDLPADLKAKLSEDVGVDA